MASGRVPNTTDIFFNGNFLLHEHLLRVQYFLCLGVLIRFLVAALLEMTWGGYSSK